MPTVAYTLPFTLVQGIVNIGSISDGSVEKDSCGVDGSRGRTAGGPSPVNLMTKTGGMSTTPPLVRGSGCVCTENAI